MRYEGVLKKMPTENGHPIQYYLEFKNGFVHLNQLLGARIGINTIGYECLCCHQPKKIFRQGFCFDCFTSSAEVGDWIMRPELSKAHLGIEDRNLVYEQKVQLQPHIVYLASSSDVKVGVTRKTQVPTRWIDQGASKAIEIVEVPNRYSAGVTEVALKQHFVDKTNWQKMLKNEVGMFDLASLRQEVELLLPNEVMPYYASTDFVQLELNYPVLYYPKKINSLNLTKLPNFEDVLIGIKGQYLLFESGAVFNVRSHEGFVVVFEKK